MSVSTIDMDAVQADAREHIVRGFESAIPWWLPLTDPVPNDDPNKTSHIQGEVFGLTTYAAQQTAPTPIDLDSEEATTTASVFERTLKVTAKEFRDNPMEWQRKVAKLGSLGSETVSDAMFVALSTLDTTAHPLDGAAYLAAQGGGTVFCSDAVTITPPNTAAFNQSNAGTTGFSGAAFDTAYQAHWQWRDKAGNRIPSYNALPDLVIPIGLRDEVDTVMQVSSSIYDGSGLVPARRQLVRNILTLPGAPQDADDWFLWWGEDMTDSMGNTRRHGALRPWIRHGPSVRVTPSPDSNHVNIVAEIEYAVVYDINIDTLVYMASV